MNPPRVAAAVGLCRFGHRMTGSPTELLPADDWYIRPAHAYLSLGIPTSVRVKTLFRPSPSTDTIGTFPEVSTSVHSTPRKSCDIGRSGRASQQHVTGERLQSVQFDQIGRGPGERVRHYIHPSG